MHMHAQATKEKQRIWLSRNLISYLTFSAIPGFVSPISSFPPFSTSWDLNSSQYQHSYEQQVKDRKERKTWQISPALNAALVTPDNLGFFFF